MQLTIESIERVPLTSKTTGKPFTSVRIKTREYPGKIISGFANVDNADWEVADVVEANVEQKGTYLNFSTPKNTHQTTETGFKPSADPLRSERKLDAILTEIQMIKTVLGDILQKVAPINNDEPHF